MSDSFITYQYTDGRPAHVSEVYQHCSVAHAYISDGVALPKTPRDLERYRAWLEEQGHDEPESLTSLLALQQEEAEAEEESTDEEDGGEGEDSEGSQSDDEEPEEEEDNTPEPSAAAVELAEEHDIDLSEVQGSGADGRIVVYDVQAVIDDDEEE